MSRSQEIIIDIKATPEEVFRAVSEADGITKWFVPEARVDPRVGGEYYISFGPGMSATNIISAYDPYTHFGAYRERSFAFGREGKPVETGVTRKIATDYYIEALGDGVTRLRLVQSGFGPEDAWDGELESTKSGWTDFMKKLKEVLEG
jgi:uncharacterized protein YndB with AHSA1/START domain